TRKGMPDELKEQMPLIRTALDAMKIRYYLEDGIEADDILGTLSKQFQEDSYVTVLSGDRDLLQLASEHTKVSITKTAKGETFTEHFFREDFIRTYGFTPTQFIDVKGMMGDSSDNIPGIPSVGEKTAHKFIMQYGSLEGLYEHVNELPGKAKINVENNKELAFLSRELATIKTDCILPLEKNSLALGDYLNEDAFALFKELNFTRLLSRFNFTEMEQRSEQVEISYELLTTPEQVLKLLNQKGNSKIAIYSHLDDAYFAFSFVLRKGKTSSAYVFECSDEDFVDDSSLRNRFIHQWIEALNKFESVLFFDIKDFAHRFLLPTELILSSFQDLMLEYYLLYPNKGSYTLSDLSLNYTEYNLERNEDLVGKGKSLLSFSEVDQHHRLKHFATAALVIEEAYPLLTKQLDEEGMLGLYNTLEKPLLKVLYGMERTGIHVDVEVLNNLSKQLEEELGLLTKSIYELSGQEFNINSPKQLGKILFEDLGLVAAKKTKSGYSTDVEVLEKLKGSHPIIEYILNYRQLSKLKSTYADGLIPFIQEDQRIHTTFNQTIASTGRLSSTDPNLQNIPVRLEQGRLIRKAFIPEPGYVFIDADYSQIELRLLAHISEDETFIEAFRNNDDIHRITASQVFHVHPEEVDAQMRRNAKAVNFGIVYGISDYGLSRDLDIPVFEARKYIEAYFIKYPKVKSFLDEVVAKAYQDGFVTTMYNRKRPIPELKSSNYMQRQFGERIAMNTPIQGSAADIIKIAMIKVEQRLRKEKLQARLILQVHDELIVETPVEEQLLVMTILSEEMERCAKLLVPLVAKSMSAFDWYDAK
ncbi:MAG: DNA polymerase I, partial [Vallitaleaceae bacterium]|nr:DNA polymerase I [Vallitaleaceae bacterium]